ncbi:DUF4625 domain-containing protein [Limibacter armeniacum]|uniref:DUF4625 domain-containing protein n=1 Tax=Limibacter armeniacum TaxID=466084 RepID=UPI002FE69AF2
MKLRNILTILLATMVIWACDDSDDEIADGPVIEQFAVHAAEGEHNHEGEEEEHDEEEVHVTIGSTMDVEAVISGEAGVTAYKITIHPAFDGHSHRVAVDNIGWNFNSNVDLTGTTLVDVEDEIAIPLYINSATGLEWKEEDGEENKMATPEGDYHLLLFALDANGRDAMKEQVLHLENEQ